MDTEQVEQDEQMSVAGEFVRELQLLMPHLNFFLFRSSYRKGTYDIHVRVESTHEGATKLPDLIDQSSMCTVWEKRDPVLGFMSYQRLHMREGGVQVTVHFKCVRTKFEWL